MEKNNEFFIDKVEINKEELTNYLLKCKSLIIDLNTGLGLDKLAGHPVISISSHNIVEYFENNSPYYKSFDFIVLICPFGKQSRALAEILQYKRFPVTSLKNGFISLFQEKKNA